MDGWPSTKEMHALGRPFQPGTLYDYRNDDILSGKTASAA